MTAERDEKRFDCVKFMREQRDRLSDKMATMSSAEFSDWLDSRRYDDPVLQRLANLPPGPRSSRHEEGTSPADHRESPPEQAGSPTEITFEVRSGGRDGPYTARAPGFGLSAAGGSIEEIRRNVRKAVEHHFDDLARRPRAIRLRVVGEEVLQL